jgi:hypothetical protein
VAVVVGTITDELGTPVQAARLEVRGATTGYARVLEATGGAFGLRDAPVGERLTLTASAPGFGARTRTLEVLPPSDTDETRNRADFGGTEAGMWHYLSRFPEVARVEPGNMARGVSTAPLRVTLTFSHPIREADRGRLDDLLRLRPTFKADEGPLAVGVGQGAAVTRVSWADDGASATLTFDGPLVARHEGVAYELYCEPSDDLSRWPRDAAGRTLGQGVAPTTRDGAGAALFNRIAPFLRPSFDEPRPSARPSPLTLWGATHHVSVRFEPARNVTPLRVVSVEHVPPDAFLVTFDKPVWGYPASALSPQLTLASNYRIVLGNASDRRERAAFEATDARTGSSPGRGVELDPKQPLRVLLRDESSRFVGMNRYKLHVGAGVESVHGAAIGGDGVVLEGTL